jgi:hypothetical protein
VRSRVDTTVAAVTAAALWAVSPVGRAHTRVDIALLVALRNGTTIEYMHDRGVDWLSDFTLHVVGFVADSRAHVHPPPTVDIIKGLPQYPPFPGDALA